MATLADRVLDQLRQAPGGLDDGALAAALDTTRQSISAACRRLVSQGRLERVRGERGTLLNVLSAAPAPAPPPPAAEVVEPPAADPGPAVEETVAVVEVEPATEAEPAVARDPATKEVVPPAAPRTADSTAPPDGRPGRAGRPLSRRWWWRRLRGRHRG